MAGQSEIFLANSTGEQQPTKNGKSRTRRKGSAKPAKKSAAPTTSKPANENKTADTDVVPMIKLRAIDIAGEAKPESPEDGQNGESQRDGSPILKMPATSVSSAIAGNGSEQPQGVSDADAVTDPELLELLEQLSVTIDTANTVLDAAATSPGEATSSPNPKPEPQPEPEPDSESEDPPPLAAQFASLSPTPPPADNKQTRGVSSITTAIIAGLTLTAGVGWLLFTNPWLIDDGAKVSTAPDTSARTSSNERAAPALANVAPAAGRVAARPGAGPALPRVQNQPVTAPKISIAQPITGKAGQSIALAINLPASASQTEISIMIQGVPDKAKLSAGKSLGSGNWLLSESELQGLTLNAAAAFVPASFELDVILVRSDGKVPEVHKLPVTIKPAAPRTAVVRTPDGVGPPSSATTYMQTGVSVSVPVAPSQVVAKPAPAPAAPAVQMTPAAKSPRLQVITQNEVRTLLARANSLLEQGDVAGARLLLEYAAQRGSKRAMLRMGETYDPDQLLLLGVRGVQPDQDQAALWYDRAAKATPAR